MSSHDQPTNMIHFACANSQLPYVRWCLVSFNHRPKWLASADPPFSDDLSFSSLSKRVRF